MRLWKFFFCNFMWLYVIHAVINLSGSFAFILSLFMLLCFASGLLGLLQMKHFNSLDIIVFVFLMIIAFNIIAVDYPHHLKFLIFAFVFQICPMMCYFTARTNEIELELVLKKMLIPITFIMILGVYLHLAQPEWYTSIKWSLMYDRYGTNYITENQVIEHMRLTSIFNSSYYVAYATFFFSSYLLYALSFGCLDLKRKTLYIGLLLICVLVLFYANHRSTILGFIVTYVFCFIKGSNKAIRRYMIVGVGVIAAIVVIILFSSEDYSNYISMRFQEVSTKSGFQERFDHTGGELDLLSFMGQGFGRYSIRAREYGGWALIDSQYQNILGELGIVGIIVFLLILIVALVKAFNNSRKVGLELCVFLFFVIAFLGASALTIDSEYSFIFWYALGRISKKSSHITRKIPLTTENAILLEKL